MADFIVRIIASVVLFYIGLGFGSYLVAWIGINGIVLSGMEYAFAAIAPCVYLTYSVYREMKRELEQLKKEFEFYKETHQ